MSGEIDNTQFENTESQSFASQGSQASLSMLNEVQPPVPSQQNMQVADASTTTQGSTDQAVSGLQNAIADTSGGQVAQGIDAAQKASQSQSGGIGAELWNWVTTPQPTK